MGGNESDIWMYQPMIPLNQRGKYLQRWITYLDTYELLAQKYAVSDTFFDAPNVSIQSINNFVNGINHPELMVSGPIIQPEQADGNRWQFASKLLNPPDPPPPDDPQIDFWSMCTGLAIWQMYNIGLAQQIQRLGNFGYYGRKKGD